MRSHSFQTELLSELEGEDGNNRERWILSYADFITLMFAFFVVMYSVSSVNDGKFRVLSQTMANVFQNAEVAAAVEQRLLERAQQRVTQQASIDGDDTAQFEALADPATLRADELGEVLVTLLSKPIAEQGVQVRTGNDWTEVELASAFVFDGDSTEISAEASAAIAHIAELARAVDVPIRVEGFTDNVPMGVGIYASNRERSAAWAASVADALVAAGADSERIAASGFGEQFPQASNASSAGRAQNRRVVINLARHDRVPPAAASSAAQSEQPEQVASRTLTRVTELPGPESIRL